MEDFDTCVHVHLEDEVDLSRIIMFSPPGQTKIGQIYSTLSGPNKTNLETNFTTLYENARMMRLFLVGFK